MPATPLIDPPGIRCVFSDGTTAEFTLEGLPCPQLVSDLLTGLAELIHPHGSIDAANSVDLCLPPIRNFAAGLAARGFDGGAADLRRGLLVEYWMETRRFRWENRLRRMLRGFDAATGRLDPGVRELLAGRSYASTPHRTPLPPYSEAEWGRLAATCQEITGKSYAAHREALAAAARGTSPALDTWTADNLAWLLARLGPVGTPGVAAHLGCSLNAVQKRGGVGGVVSRDGELEDVLVEVPGIVLAVHLHRADGHGQGAGVQNRGEVSGFVEAVGRSPVEFVFDDGRRALNPLNHGSCQICTTCAVYDAMLCYRELLGDASPVIQSFGKREAITAAMLHPGGLGIVQPLSESGVTAYAEVALAQQAVSVPGDDGLQRWQAQEWQDALAGIDGPDEFAFNSSGHIIEQLPRVFLRWATSAANRPLTRDGSEWVCRAGVDQEEDARHDRGALRERGSVWGLLHEGS
jgi:hypothetical protein